MNSQTSKQEYGFTLIELLVVVAIVGLLAAIAVPQFAQYRERSYIAGSEILLKSARTDMEAYLGSSTDGTYSVLTASRGNTTGTPWTGGTGVDILLPSTRVGIKQYVYVDTRACVNPEQISFFLYAAHYNASTGARSWKGCGNAHASVYKQAKTPNSWW